MDRTTSVIIGCVSITGGMSVVRHLVEGEVTAKPIVGSLALGALLLAVGMASDDTAKAFAVLVAVTSVLVNGAVVFERIGEVVG